MLSTVGFCFFFTILQMGKRRHQEVKNYLLKVTLPGDCQARTEPRQSESRAVFQPAGARGQPTQVPLTLTVCVWCPAVASKMMKTLL